MMTLNDVLVDITRRGYVRKSNTSQIQILIDRLLNELDKYKDYDLRPLYDILFEEEKKLENNK